VNSSEIVDSSLLGFCRLRGLRQTSPSLPPKGTDPRTLPLLPCKQDIFRGPRKGAMIAIVDP
jgi:hypothetical protein